MYMDFGISGQTAAASAAAFAGGHPLLWQHRQREVAAMEAALKATRGAAAEHEKSPNERERRNAAHALDLSSDKKVNWGRGCG